MLTKEQKWELVKLWVKSQAGGELIRIQSEEAGEFLQMLDNHNIWCDQLFAALECLPWNPKFRICMPRYQPATIDKHGEWTGGLLFIDGKDYHMGEIQIFVDASLQCRNCGNLCFGTSYCLFNIPEIALLEADQIVELVRCRVISAILSLSDVFPGKEYKLLYEKQLCGLTHGDGCKICTIRRGSLYAPDSKLRR